MSDSPTLNGPIIGQAERATRAVLDRLLSRTGTTFGQWVALSLTAADGTAIDRDRLIAQMAGALKIDDSEILAAIAELAAAGLLENRADDSQVGLAEAGWVRYREIRSAINDVTARMYGDLPVEELTTAVRVLTAITRRADEVLADA